MDTDDNKMIFSTPDKADIDRAADYLGECNISCEVKENDGSYELWVMKKGEQALALLEDILPQYFTTGETETGETDDEDDREDAPEASLMGVSITGKILIILSLAAGAVVFFVKLPLFKVGTIVLASLSVLLNGYEGFKSRKTLPTLLCMAAIAVLLFGIIYPVTTDQKSQETTARQPLNTSDYDNTLEMNALQLLNAREYDKALEAYDKALISARERNDLQSEAFSLSYMGSIYTEKAMYEKALELYSEANRISEEAGIGVLKQITDLEITRLKDLTGL